LSISEAPTERDTPASAGKASVPGDSRFMWAIIVVAGVSLWLNPMFSSLWLDETVTWWVVKDGFGDMVHRAVTYQQSPLYYVFAWIARVVGGNAEFVLRLPSLLLATGAAFLFYRLVRHLVDAETGRLAVLAFVASPWIAFAAGDARPYALALLLSVASAYTLIRWLDRARFRDGIVHGLCVILTIWAHYLFAPTILAFWLYAALRVRRGTSKISWGQAVGVAAIIVAGISPLIAQMMSLWGRRGLLSIPATPSADAFFSFLLPPLTIGAIALGGFVAFGLTRRIAIRSVTPRPLTLALGVLWAVTTPLLFYAMAVFTSVDFLSKRYSVGAVPGVALVVGWGVSRLDPVKNRNVVALVVALFSVLAFGGSIKTGEDWREAVAYINRTATPQMVVLVHPGLIESSDVDWFDDTERRDYLLSPFSRYPLVGREVLLPYTSSVPGAQAYLNDVASSLEDSSRVILLTQAEDYDALFKDWFDGRLEQAGLRSTVLAQFGVLQVIEYSKT
jgi:mannosyltransferase